MAPFLVSWPPLLALLACGGALGQQGNGGGAGISTSPEGWLRGRTSWYGTPDWVQPFEATRGGGRAAFGVLEWGGCGLTNGDGEVLVPKEQAGAYSDDNPDYPGSCGRCYEVKCVDAPVLGGGDKPIPLEELYYFPKFADVPDELGRPFPGNPTEAQNYYTVTCYNNDPFVVKIIDQCPCLYCPEGEAGQCRYQESCCYKSIDHPKAGQPALDVSFWAFQQMAHPSYGVIMVDYRPVDCATREPLAFIPGRISRKLYADAPGAGWAWFASKRDPNEANRFTVRAGGAGLGNSSAACAFLAGELAMTFWSRGAGVPGFEPFVGVQALSFWLRNTNQPGAAVPVRVALSGDQSKPTNSPTPLPWEPPVTFCSTEVFLTERTPDARRPDGWLKYVMPISDFGCEEDEIRKLNKIDFLALRDTEFCVDEAELL